MSLNTALLRSSFADIIDVQPQLTRVFYRILFERYPQVKPLFGNNAQEAQEKMLAEALVAVLDHLEDASWLKSTLGGMGQKHEDYGVTPEMFDWVGDALLSAMAESAGDAWNPEVEAAWTAAYGAIAGMMLEGYSQA